MTRSVRVLTRAQNDVAACYAFIAERSAQGAANWFNRFAETRDRLAFDADMRPVAPESVHFNYDIREVFFKTRKGNAYRILFTILKDHKKAAESCGVLQESAASKTICGG